jgi:hypothetical protein
VIADHRGNKSKRHVVKVLTAETSSSVSWLWALCVTGARDTSRGDLGFPPDYRYRRTVSRQDDQMDARAADGDGDLQDTTCSRRISDPFCLSARAAGSCA